MIEYPHNFSHAVMFHHFHDKKHPKGQGAISGEEFEQILNWLDNHYLINDAHVYIEKVLNNDLHKSDICLSFDDALLCQYDIALPILKKKAIKAFFFVYSSPFGGDPDYLEIFRYFRTVAFEDVDDFYDCFFKEFKKSKYASSLNFKNIMPADYLDEFSFYSFNDKLFRYLRDEILKPNNYKKLMLDIMDIKEFNLKEVLNILWLSNEHLKEIENNGHIIGLHSNSHPMKINDLDILEQKEEYEKNVSHLRSILDQDIISMSHPCGNYDSNTLKILRDLGIKIGFRSNTSMQSIKSNLEIPREDHANILKIIQK